jgi:hypothetical protein
LHLYDNQLFKLIVILLLCTSFLFIFLTKMKPDWVGNA